MLNFRQRRLFSKFQIPEPTGLVESGQECGGPTQLLDRQTFGAVEAVKIGAPGFSRLWRGLAEVGKGEPDFHLPELILVTGIADGALHFDGALHPFGSVAPITLKRFGDAFWIKIVGDNGVEDTTQRVPLEFEITAQLFGCNEELDDLFLPEFTIAVGESGLDVHVLTSPCQVERRLIVPEAHFSMLPLRPGAIVLKKRLEPRGFGPGRFV